VVIMVNGLTTMTQTTYTRRVEDQREQVRRLYEAGLSVIQIARATGVTRSAVYQMLQTLGLPVPSRRAK
jgi:DNA invertase Pin-like site-specific DNA recombinase